MMRFEKHSALIVLQEKPFNAGPPLGLLRQTFLTPKELFFVRNHGSVPEINPTRYRLSVGGRVKKRLTLSLGDLRDRFPKVALTATLQCAGNRRTELIAIHPVPGELPWDANAIGNAAWAGVALREVLLAAGIDSNARHVAFTGLDEVDKDGRKFGFGGSIPIEKAMTPEVVLAYEMNGEPLTPVHGFPLRVVVPGYIGARSVKWLTDITVQAEPSTNYFQSHAYKLFPPHVRSETADWTRGMTLGELPVNAVICQPPEGETIPAGRVLVRGYAVAGGGRHIERVDLSVDQGLTWVTADLWEEQSPWAWRLWEAKLELRPGPCQIVVRAWDSAANTQPEDGVKIWNFKGYVNNSWHRVRVQVVG